MKRLPHFILTAILLAGTAGAQIAPKPVIKYGTNPAAGKYFAHDGVKLYYGQWEW
jgi:hypothetical protein